MEFGWKRDKFFTLSQPRAKLEANTNMNKQIIYGSAVDVQLIVLILNKPILYGSAVDVQLIVLILNKPIPCGSAYIIYRSAMDVTS